jgi:hypothetical protein
VIAVDTPAARDVLGNFATFVADNATQLAHAMAIMPSSPPPEQRALARNAAARFGVDIQTARVMDLYADLIEREPALAR